MEEKGKVFIKDAAFPSRWFAAETRELKISLQTFY